MPSAFHTVRGAIEPLDSPRNERSTERLAWDVRRGMSPPGRPKGEYRRAKPEGTLVSAILNHPWLPKSGPDAVSVRGFAHDVDTGKLAEVSYPGPMGSIG